jgi:hypothetical protein
LLQLRKIVIRGVGLRDAAVEFAAGANIIAGESDTGKSYLLHCIDYIFGAEKLNKRIREAEAYEKLFVEFENSSGEYLSLVRALSGGDIAVHKCRINEITGEGAVVYHRRRGTSIADDVTTILFLFAGIPEAKLRKNVNGETQRLTIRTFMPATAVDEISIINELSPILGEPGFDQTARQRMFAFMLSGKDDSGVIAMEKKEIARAKLNAQLGLIDDLLAPLENRLSITDSEKPDDTIDKLDDAIEDITKKLVEFEAEREGLLIVWGGFNDQLRYAETQILAINELLNRYNLLNERYDSDLERLDFVSEGSYYLDSLQTVNCPLCDQLMSADHVHKTSATTAEIYDAARAEAAKILAQRSDLAGAILSLKARQTEREQQRAEARVGLEAANRRLNEVVQPSLRSAASHLQVLMDRRLKLEMVKGEREQLDSLRTLKDNILSAAPSRGPKREWEELPGAALRLFCDEVEKVLREWNWPAPGKVEFDKKTYDIIVDGQSRQSHGKGVRAVLYSAFVVSLLRFCKNQERSHPGFIVVDSPLTSYKKNGGKVKGSDGGVGINVEAAFWASLKEVNKNIQIIVIENKEPPEDVAASVHYERFAGDEAVGDERIALFPV